MAVKLLRLGIDVRIYFYFHHDGSLYYHWFGTKADSRDIAGMAEQLSAHAQGFV